MGNIYVGTNGSNVVKVTPAGTVTNYSSNTFTTPCSLAYDKATNMLAVGDASTGTVYAVDPLGVSITIATGIGTMSGIAATPRGFCVYDSTNGMKVITMKY
jgi:DNA-binding beta-propeller fold protein YncE